MVIKIGPTVEPISGSVHGSISSIAVRQMKPTGSSSPLFLLQNSPLKMAAILSTFFRKSSAHLPLVTSSYPLVCLPQLLAPHHLPLTLRPPSNPHPPHLPHSPAPTSTPNLQHASLLLAPSFDNDSDSDFDVTSNSHVTYYPSLSLYRRFFSHRR